MENRSMTTSDAQRDTIRQACAAYTQSEKVKSGIIWICQVAEQVAIMDDVQRKHGIGLLKTLAHLIADEADLGGRLTGDPGWHEIGRKINMALVMIESGVPQETGFHLTRALTRVTHIGSQAAAILDQHGLY